MPVKNMREDLIVYSLIMQTHTIKQGVYVKAFKKYARLNY